MDLPVLLKLQRRVKELEQEKQSLWQQLDKREEAQQEKAKVCTKTPMLFINGGMKNIKQTEEFCISKLM